MNEIKVLSRTQRIIVSSTKGVSVINAGAVGPAGPSGLTGPQGPTGPGGVVGGHRFYGEGPPGTIIGSQPNDEYLDTVSGDLYTLL